MESLSLQCQKKEKIKRHKSLFYFAKLTIQKANILLESDRIICEHKDNVIVESPYGLTGLIGMKYNGDVYYYDNETGVYYLNFKYYSPKLRRFINANEK